MLGLLKEIQCAKHKDMTYLFRWLSDPKSVLASKTRLLHFFRFWAMSHQLFIGFEDHSSPLHRQRSSGTLGDQLVIVKWADPDRLTSGSITVPFFLKSTYTFATSTGFLPRYYYVISIFRSHTIPRVTITK